MILEIAEHPELLTASFLCDVHRVCMKTSKILPLAIPGAHQQQKIQYLTVGKTRQASRKNVIISGPPRVQFCPFGKVDEELRKFVRLAQVCP
jgi:hypothetical protein